MKKKYIALITIVLIAAVLTVFFLWYYTPIPLLEVQDIDIAHIATLQVNTGDANFIYIENYDECALLECLSKYEIRRTDSVSRSLDNYAFNISFRYSGGNHFLILIGKKGYIEDSTNYEILNHEQLLADLVSILGLKLNDDGFVII